MIVVMNNLINLEKFSIFYITQSCISDKKCYDIIGVNENNKPILLFKVTNIDVAKSSINKIKEKIENEDYILSINEVILWQLNAK